MKSPYSVLLAPLITEKGTLISESGQVIFKVHRDATKIEVRQAVEKLFECKVQAVRTINYLGKTRRIGMMKGRRSSWKKAYVTLAEGTNPAELLEKL